jgi:hypothetical protein
MLADKLPSREMILAELEYRATHRIESFYPETGPLRRELYRKHMDFFEAGARYNERLFLAATAWESRKVSAPMNAFLHLTGKYPAWWRGRRFGRSKARRRIAPNIPPKTQLNGLKTQVFRIG